MDLFRQLFLLIALLTAVALSATPQPSNSTRAVDVTANASFPDIGMHLVLLRISSLMLTYIGPHDLVLNYDDLMSGPESKDRFANISAPASAFTALDTDSAAGRHGLIIRIGESKQHVGELNGQRMWDMIHDALMNLCPIERGKIGCYGGMPGARLPFQYVPDEDRPNAYYGAIIIEGIPYKDKKGNYATNAMLLLTMQGMFREQNFPGLAAATVSI